LPKAAKGAGYILTEPPADPEAGWCVLDGAALRATVTDRPDILADRLRLRGTMADGVMVSLQLEATGLRLRPKLSDRNLDDRLETLMRLQGADLRFEASVNPATDTLEIRELVLRLSGGTELTVGADIRGAGPSARSLPGGSLTALDLDWRNDGNLPRPVMEIAGERLGGGLKGTAAVDATRQALSALVEALPDAAFDGGGKDALARMVASLPQGRGRLLLSLTAPDGIGAARLLIVGLSDDPLGPKALASLLQGARLTVSWQPGLMP